jgi:hypothetical protein
MVGVDLESFEYIFPIVLKNENNVVVANISLIEIEWM